MTDKARNKAYTSGIIAWFASNPIAANLLMALVMILGLLEVGSIRKEAFPSIDPDTLTVSIEFNSGSAKQSEEGLAFKIEEQLEDILGIKSVTSASTGHGTIVTVEKQSDYNLDTLLQDVKTKVDAISSFPVDAKNPVVEKSERQQHSLWLQLYGGKDRHQLQQLADQLKTDLLEHTAINRVSVSGELSPMMVIEIDEERLQTYGLSISEVEDAINRNSSTPINAVLHNATTYLQLQASKQAYVTADFAQLPLITTGSGHQVLLGDVANIRDTFDDSTAVLSRYNQHTSIALQVITTGQDDISESVSGAREVIKRWRDTGNLPSSVELDSWYDRSTVIEERLQLLIKNAATGIVLVFILLALFLNLRVAFWVAAGLPFIFLGTLYLMGDRFLGLSLNEFTTFGFILALGIVVDDAVVVGESVYSVRLREGDTLQNTIKGTMLVAVPTLFGVFTTVAAFFALSNIEGFLGEIYAQFAVVVTLCLLLSIVESKLILPAHLAHLNTQKSTPKNFVTKSWHRIQGAANDLFVWLDEQCYVRVIRWALHYRYAVTVLFIALFALVIAMPFTGAVRLSFFPDIPGDTISGNITMAQDSSFGMTHQNLSRMESDAYAIDYELSGDGNGYIKSLQIISQSDQSGSVTIELQKDTPYHINQFTRRWRERVGHPEGSRSVNIQSSPRMVDALRIELRATDDQVLSQAGKAIKQALLQVNGVSGIKDNLQPSLPQMTLSLTQQGRALGLTTAQLAQQIMQAFSGQVVQRYQRNSDEIEVKVRYPENDRRSPADVLKASIRLIDGTIVPLSSIAKINYNYTRYTITRIDGKRAVYLSADVDKELISATELVTQLKQGSALQLEQQYSGLDIQFGGEAEQQAETQSSMGQVFMIALLIIYMLLAIPLKSYIQPVLIMTAIPFGVVGAILGHWINDIALGILSLNGIIALSGVVVNDSLLLVARFNDLQSTSNSRLEAITHACRSRLRAVLLTSLTTFAGLLPLLSETSFQAQFLIPAAVSLGYGILFATVITLIIIPSILCIQLDVVSTTNRLWK